MKIITYILAFILIVIGFTFACLNAETINLNYYIGQHELPLSLLLAISLFVGGLIGWLSGLSWSLKLKKQNFILQHKVRVLEKEIEQKQKQPLEDDVIE